MQYDKLKFAGILRNIARYTLLVLSVTVIIFALLSGSENYGGGIAGIIKNSPNAIPWLILLFLVYIAWKRELTGGIIIILSGIWMTYFFNFTGPNFFPVTFILTSAITILGSLFVISWYLRRSKS